MSIKLCKGANAMRHRILMAVLALLFGVCGSYLAQLGLLFMPLVAAPLAVLFVLEREGKRIFTVIVPLLMLVSDALFNGIYSFSCAAAIIVALLIYASLATGFLSKGDSAVASVLAVTLVIYVTVVLYGCHLIGKLNPAASLEYYRGLVVDLEASWVSAFSEYIAMTEQPSISAAITEDVMIDLYYGIVHSAYSIVFVFAFLLVGLTNKLFARLLYRHVESKGRFLSWRFTLSPAYACVFFALYVLQLFADGYDTFAIVVTNLVNVFAFVFAYIGYMIVDAYFRMKSDGRSGGALIVFVALAAFGSTAITVLSLIGAVVSVMMGKNKPGPFEENGGGNLGGS